MKVAIYPGTFNPWHEGHDDVLQAAMAIFDRVIIARGVNPDKSSVFDTSIIAMDQLRSRAMDTVDPETDYHRVKVVNFDGLLVDFIGRLNKEGTRVTAVVRGLRNFQDFEAEKTQQYWNQSLGLSVPTLYLIADAEKVHISSSALRAIEKMRKKK